MTKFLLWMLLIYIAWRWWGKRLQAARRHRDQKAASPQSVRVLACETCQVYLPEGEGVQVDGRFFCGDKCCRSAGLMPPKGDA